MFARERLAWPSSGLPCRRRGRSATRGSTCSAAREHHGPGRSTAARHARQPHARPCSPRAGASSARSRAGAGASGSRRRNQRRRRVPLSLLRFAELAQGREQACGSRPVLLTQGAALRCWRSWRARCASRAGAAPSAGRPATPRSWAPRARQSLQSPRQGPGQGPCPLLRRTRPAATAAATAAVPRRAPAACGRGQGCTPCTAAPAAPAPARRAPARRSRAARTAWGRTRSPHGCPPCSRGASRRSTRSRRGHWPAPHCRGGVQRCVRYKWGGDGPARRHDVK